MARLLVCTLLALATSQILLCAAHGEGLHTRRKLHSAVSGASSTVATQGSLANARTVGDAVDNAVVNGIADACAFDGSKADAQSLGNAEGTTGGSALLNQVSRAIALGQSDAAAAAIGESIARGDAQSVVNLGAGALASDKAQSVANALGKGIADAAIGGFAAAAADSFVGVVAVGPGQFGKIVGTAVGQGFVGAPATALGSFDAELQKQGDAVVFEALGRGAGAAINGGR
ncbi:hypothetical protein N2152v2_009731 [Parachlorella kessleri]